MQLWEAGQQMRISLEGLPDVAATVEPAEAAILKDATTDGVVVREGSLDVAAEVVEKELVAEPVQNVV